MYRSRKIQHKTARYGLTLIEILVTIFIISSLTLILMRFLIGGIQLYHVNEQTVKLQENISKAMREFEYSTRAATLILKAENNELTYYRYYDLVSAAPTQVHYFMDGNQFKVGKTLPQGTAPNITYPANNEVVVLLIGDVKNPDSLFKYYNENDVQLTGTVDLASIKMIGLTISLDNTTKTTPKTVDGSTMVNLRNMKTNL